MRHTTSLRAAAALLLALVAGQALAQNNKAAADVLFDQGKKLMGEGKFAEACPKFAESQKLDPAPGTLVWLADCYEKNGQIASSWSTYREALAAAKAAGQAQRESLAKERISALEKLLSYLTVQVADRGVGGLEVKVDGQPLGQALWGTAVPYDPGPHSVEASAPGHAPFQTKIDLGKEGARQIVDVPRLKPSAAAPAASTSPAAPSTAAPPSTAPSAPPSGAPADRGSLRTVGYVVGGAGVALGGVGLVLALSGKSAAESAIDDCRKHTFCTQDDLDNHKSASSRNTIGAVLGGVGAAALIGGAVLIFTSPGDSKTGSRWLSPVVAKSFSGLSLGGNF